MQLPPGYQPHTDPQHASTYMWNPQTGDVRPIEQAAPVPQQSPQPQPPQPGSYSTPVAQPSYGTVDMAAMSADSGKVFAQRDKKIFIDIPKPGALGVTTERLVRILPPWRPDRTFPYVKYAQHRIPASFVPNPGDRKWFFFICYDTDGGPGHCPICAARRAAPGQDLVNPAVDALGPRSQYVWQALDLENLNQHFRQRVNPVTQQPELGQDGRPVYDIVPGIVKSGSQLWKAIRSLFVEPTKGDATHIEYGYPIKLKKTKTGPVDMNVEYDAVDLPKTPLDPQLRPVLANLYDLQAEFVQYSSVEEMNGVAAMIQQRVSAPAAEFQDYPPAQQLPVAQPQQGFQPVQPPAQAPQMPAVPPPAHAVVLPPAQGGQQATQPAASPLPPVGAPGGLPPGFVPQEGVASSPLGPAVAAQGTVAVPPTAAPAPGLPAGFQQPAQAATEMPEPVPPPPPSNGAVLTSGQKPDEFEAEMQQVKPGQPPF